MARDLTHWNGASLPTPCIARGRFVAIEPYLPTHREALWAALGGMGTNQLLRYFAQDDFANDLEFGAWLASHPSWITHVFRDAENAIVGMASWAFTRPRRADRGPGQMCGFAGPSGRSS